MFIVHKGGGALSVTLAKITKKVTFREEEDRHNKKLTFYYGLL